MDDATILALFGRFFDLVQLIALAYIAMMQQRAHAPTKRQQESKDNDPE